MKLKTYQNKLELTNIPKTVIGIMVALVFPILCIDMLFDEFNYWFDYVELVILIIAYFVWLLACFRSQVLRYKICFDASGVYEKKVLGKGKKIAWEHLSEYSCELTGASHRSSQHFYKLVFYATDIERPVIIETCIFSESKKQHIRDTIFPFCEKHVAKKTMERYTKI